ncbi:hypothetical protein L195_g043144 [Trifolium pratense]|uniref:Uncharacterized protein n=1 Tax=Trifolium pratense TaxID=57577 RepID=A0A2K3M8H4_TRIPR|nr:hypothetical protein L195_g043144 [Trifolium pratense]
MMAVVLGLLDFFVAGASLIFCLFLFGFIASLLSAAAFFNNAKDLGLLGMSGSFLYEIKCFLGAYDVVSESFWSLEAAYPHNFLSWSG